MAYGKPNPEICDLILSRSQVEEFVTDMFDADLNETDLFKLLA